MDVYFQEAYASCFSEIEQAEACKYRFSCALGEIHYVFLKRSIDSKPHKGYYDIITPYGYGGPIITKCLGNESALVRSFSVAFERYCQDNSIVSEFIRFHPLIRNHETFGEMYRPEFHSYNIAVDISPALDDLWHSFEQKVRKNVNKANRHSLSVSFVKSGERIDEFLDIYDSTMDRRNAGKRYCYERSFFEKLHNTLPENFCYAFVESNGKVVSSELILLGASGIMHSFLGGTKQDAFEMRPNDFLKYKAIEWGKVNNFHTYLMGGGPTPQDGVYKYKRSFAPSGICEFYLGKKIWNQELYNALCEERNISRDSTFFPLYRAPKNDEETSSLGNDS